MRLLVNTQARHCQQAALERARSDAALIIAGLILYLAHTFALQGYLTAGFPVLGYPPVFKSVLDLPEHVAGQQ
ncbi:MAG: hypothetical protein JWR75_1040 [Devosia sp.]|nr:hypothetical protein [Devosia sp.]